MVHGAQLDVAGSGPCRTPCCKHLADDRCLFDGGPVYTKQTLTIQDLLVWLIGGGERNMSRLVQWNRLTRVAPAVVHVTASAVCPLDSGYTSPHAQIHVHRSVKKTLLRRGLHLTVFILTVTDKNGQAAKKDLDAARRVVCGPTDSRCCVWAVASSLCSISLSFLPICFVPSILSHFRTAVHTALTTTPCPLHS